MPLEREEHRLGGVAAVEVVLKSDTGNAGHSAPLRRGVDLSAPILPDHTPPATPRAECHSLESGRQRSAWIHSGRANLASARRKRKRTTNKSSNSSSAAATI